MKFCQNAKKTQKKNNLSQYSFLENYQFFFKIEKFSQNMDFDFSLVEFFQIVFHY